jgi:hypothetical protein
VVDAAGAGVPTSMQQHQPQARGGDGGVWARREAVDLGSDVACDHHQGLVNERRDGGVTRSRDEHLPRFSSGEAPGEEDEAEEARRRQGGWSQRSREGARGDALGGGRRHEEELEEAGSGDGGVEPHWAAAATEEEDATSTPRPALA